MNKTVRTNFETVLKHLYINPLEKCNLKCKICYTRKTSPILTESAILEFIVRYQRSHSIDTITFCGGEVFALTYFPLLVNKLTDQGIFIQIITNGTIDRLHEFSTPNLVNLIVSLDGLPTYHDQNRGEGNFAKSLLFLTHAHELGFHCDIFSIVTKQNLSQIDEFEKHLQQELGFSLTITYHPRKPPLYLQTHPISNIFGETEGFDFLNKQEMMNLMQTHTVFPPKNLGCYQISVASDGKVYGCCEGTMPLGMMSDSIDSLVEKLKGRVEEWSQTNTIHNCLGCSQADFMCGIKQYLLEMSEHSPPVSPSLS